MKPSLSLMILASITIGMQDALAQTTVFRSFGRNDFSSIAGNITDSIAALPGLISGIAYLLGMLMGVLGILKVKDHVENPTQTPLKDGAVRMASGGALFALPIVTEAMSTTIGATGFSVAPAQVNPVTLGVR